MFTEASVTAGVKTFRKTITYSHQTAAHKPCMLLSVSALEVEVKYSHFYFTYTPSKLQYDIKLTRSFQAGGSVLMQTVDDLLSGSMVKCDWWILITSRLLTTHIPTKLHDFLIDCLLDIVQVQKYTHIQTDGRTSLKQYRALPLCWSAGQTFHWRKPDAVSTVHYQKHMLQLIQTPFTASLMTVIHKLQQTLTCSTVTMASWAVSCCVSSRLARSAETAASSFW